MLECAADTLLRLTKWPKGEVTAFTLNHMVKNWYPPKVMKDKMGIEDDAIPILWADVDFEFVGKWFIEVLKTKEPLWPMYYNPVMLDDVKRDMETLRGYLQGFKLDYVIQGEEGLEVIRGEHVRLCTMLPKFDAGVTWDGFTSTRGKTVSKWRNLQE